MREDRLRERRFVRGEKAPGGRSEVIRNVARNVIGNEKEIVL